MAHKMQRSELNRLDTRPGWRRVCEYNFPIANIQVLTLHVESYPVSDFSIKPLILPHFWFLLYSAADVNWPWVWVCGNSLVVCSARIQWSRMFFILVETILLKFDNIDGNFSNYRNHFVVISRISNFRLRNIQISGKFLALPSFPWKYCPTEMTH